MENKMLSIDVMLENPTMNLNDVTFNNLSILVGANGTGKSLILINFYACSTIMNLFVHSGLIDYKDERSIELVQFVLDNCFTDQKFTGVVCAHFTNDVKLTITIDNGVVKDIYHNLKEDTNQFTEVVYMSSNMRTFDAISVYLKLRYIYNKDKKLSSPEILSSMLSNYKMYDVTYLEGIIQLMPYTFENEDVQMLKQNFDVKEDFVSIDVDLVNGDFFFIMSNGDKKSLRSYGKGHQSIINVLLGSIIKKK